MDNSNSNKERGVKTGEVDFKKNFCMKYFNPGSWNLDVLNQVDVLLLGKKERFLLYIESKTEIRSEAERREAIAQVVLTNKKQDAILSLIGLIYQDGDGNDVMELIDCSDDSVMYNNDINWRAEKPSSPSRDAIDRINDRVFGRTTIYKNEEIREAYKLLRKGQEASINITERNVNVVYNQWKHEIVFHELISDEQDLINLFLVDLLNGAIYQKSVFVDVEENTLFGKIQKGQEEQEPTTDLIREGSNLSSYRLMFADGRVDGIKYKGYPISYYYNIDNVEQYDAFWRRYKRPPEKQEFLKILEHSSTLYSDKYRKDTGGEYTPTCFVETQNEILSRHYNLNEFIICDPCAGVGNLDNQFGKDYKRYCYLSTLVHMDVDTCRIKGFDNAIQFDYLKDDQQPLWKYRGSMLTIKEIARRENRRLMVVMNPPYQRKKGFENDLAIEFFRKVLKLEPDVIVYYCKTEFFLRRQTLAPFLESGYKVVSHIFSNAKTTFRLSEWPVSQVIFDRQNGDELTGDYITADRYELNKSTGRLDYIRTYTYDNIRPNLVTDIERHIKEDATGLRLGQWMNQSYCLVLSNRQTHKQDITTGNLLYSLLLKGINFNTHGKYFETSNLTYKGTLEDVGHELRNDALMFALFYKGNNFSNKEGQKNYLIPFTAEELGCSENDLNVLFADDIPNLQHTIQFEGQAGEVFDFRIFLRQFEFSNEAKALYEAALDIFRFYHQNKNYPNKDYNDSFYDITNEIMGKHAGDFKSIESSTDSRITRVKTAKGTYGFGRNTISLFVDKNNLPLFEHFFDARDALARKINRQLVEQKLLLWERENMY